MTQVDYKNCPFAECKYAVSELKTSMTKVSGEIKISPKIFEKLGLSASISSSLDTTVTYQSTVEQKLVKDESGFLVGLTVEIDTSIDSINISAYDPAISDKTPHGECMENRYVSTPIKNNYLMTSQTKTLWLRCEDTESLQKRQTESGVRADECFYFDAEGSLVSEPCI